jgi:tetratricopeptide (TPR) repeat protein
MSVQIALLLTLDIDHAVYDPWAHVGIGLTSERLGAVDEATEAFHKSVGDSSTAFYLDRASIFEELRAYERAEQSLRNALELAPTSAEVHNALAWLQVDKLAATDHLNEATIHARQAVELEGNGPNRANYLDTLGWAYHKLGSYGEALGHLREAADIAPYDLEIRWHLQKTERAL